jgi:hypothetical protein
MKALAVCPMHFPVFIQESCKEGPGIILRSQSGVVVHACNLSTGEAEAGGSRV